MKTHNIPSFFKTKQPNSFNFQARYYKENYNSKNKKYNIDFKSKIYRKSEKMKNYRILLLIIILSLLSYQFLTY